MKWILFLLMICIIIPGLHYTGFITLFKDSSLESISDSTQGENVKKDLSSKEKANWSPIPSPKWQAQSLSGEIFSLEELKGQIIILNFWASWCLPCHKEFPELIATTQWAKGNISLVAVSVDSSKEDIESFLKRYAVRFPKYQNIFFSNKNKHTLPFVNEVNRKKEKQIHIVWDPEFEIAKQFNVVKFPETFILNRDLKIVKKYTGEFSLKDAKNLLSSLLSEKEKKEQK